LWTNTLGSGKRATRFDSIEHYDNYGSNFDGLKTESNTILLDLQKDVWQYCVDELFQTKNQKEALEIGSSAMPHKVNPIDFGKCWKGILGIAKSLYWSHLAAKNSQSPDYSRELTD